MAINRVAKVVKGGRRFSFTALVVVGDEDQHRGRRLRQGERGPARDPEGGRARQEEPLPRCPSTAHTITHQVIGRYGSGQVLLKPASRGNRRDRGRPRARRARARRHPRRALEEPRHPEPDQPREGDGRRAFSRCSGPRTSPALRGKTVAEVLGLDEPARRRPRTRPTARRRAAAPGDGRLRPRPRPPSSRRWPTTLVIRQRKSSERRQPGRSARRCARSGCAASARTTERADGPALRGMIRAVAPSRRRRATPSGSEAADG